VQVYFYWRALQEVFPSNFVACSTAGIWLPSKVDPVLFSPAILKPQMDSFLFDTLPRILSLPESDVPWHFNSLCNSCHWHDECAARTMKENTVSMIPDLSIENATFLREVIEVGGKQGLTEIEELHSLIKVPGRLSSFQQKYPTTEQQFRRVLGMGRTGSDSPVIKAVQTGQVQVSVFDNEINVDTREADFSIPSHGALRCYHLINFGS
jgi:hypothetical protein